MNTVSVLVSNVRECILQRKLVVAVPVLILCRGLSLIDVVSKTFDFLSLWGIK